MSRSWSVLFCHAAFIRTGWDEGENLFNRVWKEQIDAFTFWKALHSALNIWHLIVKPHNICIVSVVVTLSALQLLLWFFMTSEFFCHFNAGTLFLIFLQTDFTKAKWVSFFQCHTHQFLSGLHLLQRKTDLEHYLCSRVMVNHHTVYLTSKWSSFCIVACAFSSLEKMKCGYFRKENKVSLIYCLYLEWWWMGLITQTSENCWVENVAELVWSLINRDFKCPFLLWNIHQNMWQIPKLK